MKQLLAIAAVAVILFAALGFQKGTIDRLREENARNVRNVETLLSDAEQYRTRDSLNAATIGALELTVAEYERFRAADAATIRTLQTQKRGLQAVMTAQTQTIMELSAVPRDTVIIRDSVPIPAVAVHTGDAWFDFDGLLTENEFTGTLVNRDSLLVAETVQYKRFFGFLWKTRRIKDRKIDVVGRNPHTTILNTEFITIEND